MKYWRAPNGPESAPYAGNGHPDAEVPQRLCTLNFIEVSLEEPDEAGIRVRHWLLEQFRREMPLVFDGVESRRFAEAAHAFA